MLAAVGQAQGAELTAGGVRARLLDRASRAARGKREMDVRERDVRKTPGTLRGDRSFDPLGLRLRRVRLPRRRAPGAAGRRQLSLHRYSAAEGSDHVLVADDAETRRLRGSAACWRSVAAQSAAMPITAG